MSMLFMVGALKAQMNAEMMMAAEPVIRLAVEEAEKEMWRRLSAMFVAMIKGSFDVYQNKHDLHIKILNIPKENTIALNPTQVLVVVGEMLFEFSSFEDWVNKAETRFKLAGVKGDEVICVDQKGRLLKKGKEFMRAREDNSFPVKVYLALLGD